MNQLTDRRIKILNFVFFLICSTCFQFACAPAPFQSYIRESDLKQKAKQEQQQNCFLTLEQMNDRQNDLKSSTVCMKLKWLKGFQSNQWVEAEVEFVNQQTGVSELPPLDWKFVPWMPSMGHGAGRPVVVEEVNPSRFRISKIFFTMKGEWVIQLRVKQQIFAVSPIFIVP